MRGRLNSDNIMDIVTACESSSSGSGGVAILLGKPQELEFEVASQPLYSVSPTAGAAPRWVEVADFNRDGTMDLGVTIRNHGKLSILLGVSDVDTGPP